MARVPKPGDILNLEDVEMMAEAMGVRQANFPNEPGIVTMHLVMCNIGTRFTPVQCLEGEWEGVKQDIPKGEDEPKCPNGHPIRQGPALRLVWMSEE